MHRAIKVAAKVAGVLLLALVSLGALLTAQAFVARRRRPPGPASPEQVRTELFGEKLSGQPLELAMIGDSLAAGLGADDPEDSAGVLLARGLVAASGRPVQLRNAGVIGAESKDLAGQIARLTQRGVRLEVVVIIVGGNDIMHSQRIGAAVQHLATAVRALRHRGCEVVVATCPDMGTVRLFDQPLRFIAHLLSRLLATAQTIVVLRAGGRTVSLADTIGPSFMQDPDAMFSEDRLHPSSHGYAHAAEALLPSVCAAAGEWGGWKFDLPRRIYGRARPMRWLVWLAFWAVRHGGSEVSPVHRTGRRLVHVVWRPGVPRAQ